MYDLIIRDATIVSSTTRQVADVAIQDGKIAYVGPRPPRPGREELSAIGKFLMPGVIDTAVQFDPAGSDPGIWERESRAAVTGGVTTVVSLPDGDAPVVDRKSAKRRFERASAASWVDFGLWGAATVDNAAELSIAILDGLLAGTLAFVGDGALGLEALEPHLGAPGVLGVRLSEPGARDASGVLDAARRHDRPIHLVHLSTAAELNLIDPVRGEMPVTAGCTPHHLFLSTEDDDAIRVHTHPPVRPEQDRRTLWTAVKRGRLDCIASDHHPSPPGAPTRTAGPPRGGDPRSEIDGVPGTELLFPLMLSAVRYGRLSLELLVSLCSENPARIFGLDNKGRIAKGYDADLVLFSEGEVSKVDEAELVSGAGWSPYVHREAAPKPELVMVGGKIVARRGKLVADTPSGRPITIKGTTKGTIKT
ncbi:MAG: dihydroorotase family protein [Myxococcota bacterium]